MKTNCYRGVKCRKRTALALAVLLWMADRGIAGASTLCIDADYPDTYYWTPGESLPVDADISNSGKTLSIVGGSWAGWYIEGGSTFLEGISVDGYCLSLRRAEGIRYAYGGFPVGYRDTTRNTVDMSEHSSAEVVCGGYVRCGNAIENTVNIRDSSAGNVYGGYSERGNATGNTVNIRDSSVRNVYGGRTDSGKEEKDNRVILDHAVIRNQLCGAYGNSTDRSGNVLVLSGTGNSAGEVQRFETIQLSESLSWKRDATVLKAGRFSDWNKEFDISEADFSAVTVPGKMILLSSDTEDDFAELSLKDKNGTTLLNSANPVRKFATGETQTNTKNGVTLTYALTHMVSLDASNHYKNVLYRIASGVDKVSFGEIKWSGGGTARTVDSGYDFTDVTIDASNLKFANPEAVAKGKSMTFLAGAADLPSGLGETGISSAYTYEPISGVAIRGHVTGDIASERGKIVYTATANQAERITFGSIPWLDKEALLVRPDNISFAGADVDTSSIHFNNVDSLRANQSMTLVQDFGNSVGTVEGTTYTVGTTLTGKGRASLSGNHLIYTVETGTGPEEDPETRKKPSDPGRPDERSSENETKDTEITKELNPSSGTTVSESNHKTEGVTLGETAADAGTGNPKTDSSTQESNPKNEDGKSDGTAADAGTDNPAASFSGNDATTERTPIVTAQEQTHNTVMGMEANMAALAVGNEFIGKAVEGLADSGNRGADGISVFAAMGGGTSRRETGSYIKMNTWSAIAAVGTKRELPNGALEWGGFVEHGVGKFSLYGNTSDGSGSSVYTGGGLLVKWMNAHDLYWEGSFRMGRMHSNASDVLHDAFGNSYGYDVHVNYCGGHVGLGKIYRFHGGGSLDVYGKFFMTRQRGVSFDAGGYYDLDGVSSKILQFGVRYTGTGPKWNWYGGLAYEHEFDGEASGTADGARIRSASIKGGSLMAEVGLRMVPGETSPWKMDIGLTGYAGRHRGVSGSAAIEYMF